MPRKNEQGLYLKEPSLKCQSNEACYNVSATILALIHLSTPLGKIQNRGADAWISVVQHVCNAQRLPNFFYKEAFLAGTLDRLDSVKVAYF